MKGLLLKDLFVVTEFVRVLALMAVVFIASMMAGRRIFGGQAMISLLVVSLVIFLVRYDDLAHWDSFAATLPVSRKAGRFQVFVSASVRRHGGDRQRSVARF